MTIKSSDPLTGLPVPVGECEKFEDLLEHAGTTGKGSILLFALCIAGSLADPWHSMSYQFLGLTSPYFCSIPELRNANWTSVQIKQYAIPYSNNTGEFSTCEMYNMDFKMAAEHGFDKSMMTKNENITQTAVECTERYFELDHSSIVTEWDLVCDRRYLYSTTASAIQVGKMTGGLVTGTLMDLYGRKPVVLGMLVGYLTFGFVACFSNGIVIFILCRILLSTCSSSIYAGAFMLTMELCAEKQRSMISSLFCLPWAIGYMGTPLVAYVVRPWRLLHAALTAPTLLLLPYFCFLKESPRWLFMHRRSDEAVDILNQIAAANGRTMPDKNECVLALDRIREKEKYFCSQTDSSTSTKQNMLRNLSLFVSPITNAALRWRTLRVYLLWMTLTMAYYGTAYLSSNLGANPYLFLFLCGLLEIPSYLILWPSGIYLGRRCTQVILCLVSTLSLAVATLLIISFEDAPVLALIVLCLVGKFCLTAAFHLAWVVTAELFPTKIRSITTGQASFFSRIGGGASPYVNDLMGEVSPWSPLAIFSGCSLTATIIALTLPETSKVALPDTMVDVDTVERKLKEEGTI